LPARRSAPPLGGRGCGPLGDRRRRRGDADARRRRSRRDRRAAEAAPLLARAAALTADAPPAEPLVGAAVQPRLFGRGAEDRDWTVAPTEECRQTEARRGAEAAPTEEIAA